MKKFIVPLFLLLNLYATAQNTASVDLTSRNLAYKSYKDSGNHSSLRKWLVGGLSVAGYGGSFIFLNEAWYKGYPRSPFHTFNDIGEWQQMDKTGHAWTAYTTSRVTSRMWQWAGVSRNTSILLGSSSGLLYMLSIEYLDGLSAEWGWSWGDAGADFLGSALFAGQELAWKDQRIQLKFSSHYKNYVPASLQQRANDLFGKSLTERTLKDYNAQTYWLSFNLHSFFPNLHVPDWLQISFGYGADGMFGGYDNLKVDNTGNVVFDRRDLKRYRQWYLSPDIDLSKIKTKSKTLRSVLYVLNMIKVPAPAIELSNGRLHGHWIHF